MLRSATLLALLTNVVANTQEVERIEFAAPIDPPDGWGIAQLVAEECFKIDARLGWQRIQWSSEDRVGYGVVDAELWGTSIPNHFGRPYGWSVDDARYDRVGASGHAGADADALAPYDNFKLVENIPFGALLMQENNENYSVPMRWVEGMTLLNGSPLLGVPVPGTQSVDLRINDTALSDNGGFLVICRFS